MANERRRTTPIEIKNCENDTDIGKTPMFWLGFIDDRAPKALKAVYWYQ